MNKKKILLAIGLVVLLLGIGLYFYWQTNRQKGLEQAVPSAEPIPLEEITSGDTSSAIQQEIENIDLGDLDSELQAIDQELENL
ncbi:MAG: hypothetical protein AB1721_00070 [Patescibacteria group bacterium]